MLDCQSTQQTSGRQFDSGQQMSLCLQTAQARANLEHSLSVELADRQAAAEELRQAVHIWLSVFHPHMQCDTAVMRHYKSALLSSSTTEQCCCTVL